MRGKRSWPIEHGVVELLVESIGAMRNKNSVRLLEIAEGSEMNELLSNETAWRQEVALSGVAAASAVRRVMRTSDVDALSTMQALAQLAAQHFVLPSAAIQPREETLRGWISFLVGEPVPSRANDVTIEAYWNTVAIVAACLEARGVSDRGIPMFVDKVARTLQRSRPWPILT